MRPSFNDKLFVNKQHKSWEVTFEVINDDYCNIIHFTKNGNKESEGDRNPVVWFIPNTLALLATSSVERDSPLRYITPNDIPVDAYTTVTIRQEQIFMETYQFSVIINGHVEKSEIHTSRNA